jgi:hypothetical protein
MARTGPRDQQTSRSATLLSGQAPAAGDDEYVTTTASATTPSRRMDVDRLCVAARSVLDQMAGLVAEGLPAVAVEQVTRHAQALIDLNGLRGRPLAAMRAHALAVHDALTLLAGDRSLTLAVWFEDGLGTR